MKHEKMAKIEDERETARHKRVSEQEDIRKDTTCGTIDKAAWLIRCPTQVWRMQEVGWKGETREQETPGGRVSTAGMRHFGVRAMVGSRQLGGKGEQRGLDISKFLPPKGGVTGSKSIGQLEPAGSVVDIVLVSWNH